MATLNQIKGISDQLALGQEKKKAQTNQFGQAQAINQIAAAAPGQVSAGKANQFAGQATQAIGQQQVQQADQGVKAANQIASQAQAVVGSKNNQDLFSQDMNNKNELLDQKDKLASLASTVDRSISADREHFALTQAGQSHLNQRNLLDYAIKKQKKQEDFADYQQLVNQTTQRKMQIMETVYRKLSQAAEHSFKSGDQKADQAMRKELVQMKAAYEKKMQKERAKSSNTRAMFTAAGTIAGAVVGTYFGPAGTVAGASIGAAAGGAVGGAVANEG